MRQRMRNKGNVARIEEFVERISETGCWIWMRRLGPTGYGGAWDADRKKPTSAHRLSYRTFVGEIPDHLEVLHRCDVKCCVNPHHLRLGTHQENMTEAVERGLFKQRRFGSRVPTARLTEEQVASMRERYARGGVRQVDLAAEYGVGQSAVSVALTGQGWPTAGGPLKTLETKNGPTRRSTDRRAPKPRKVQ